MKILDTAAILKDMILDEVIYGESITHISKSDIRRIDPLSDEFKELKYGCKIENLSKQEIIDRYGDSLTKEEIWKIQK